MVDTPEQPSGDRAPGQARDSDRRNVLFALRIVGDFGVTIAVPVVLFAIIGKHLDTAYGTAPWFLIAGFVLAAVISAVAIVRKAKRYAQEYEELQK